jgi:HEAT repeat protein
MSPKPVKTSAVKATKSSEVIDAQAKAVEVKPFPAPAAVESAVTAKPVVAAVAPIAKAPAAATPASPELVAALRDPSAEVALEAAASLGRLANVAAVEPLLEVVANRDGFFHGVVRAAAATSLGQLHDARAVEPLIAALHDPMAEASQEAVLALGELGDARAVSPLLAVVENTDGFFLGTVRRAAVRALNRLRDPRAIKTLAAIAARDEEDAAVREAAADAVRTLSLIAR